ncbi:arginyl-tRNA synthetase [Roseibium hamelinense]|uniref:Arginine--tRNA ligase n=1 Tax=Roseibium hamelinense TaxID=150831 RepID=A0A562TIN6_9HYPH|nr:arginine--tRNA ligase [Roseibium hamelinense]MTI45662.1 arginine--tRNA ligase [Roseibium hamelinense]TWI93154.1 arginyl-tRNA synthetase [Roseibium hamelinense]
MNIFAEFSNRVQTVLQSLDLSTKEGDAPDLSRVTVETPRDPAHGDLATNAAMVLSKQVGMKPRDLAEKLVDKLQADPEITEAAIAGPGFINLRVSHSVWENVLGAVLAQQLDFGRSRLGTGKKVNVEYVSANPTGPMHVGHTRGAVVGDALANLLDFAGYDVTREYYINDAGSQIETLARSAFLRYREALGEDIGAIPAGLYPGDYLKPVGQALAKEHGDALTKMADGEWLPIVKDFTVAAMLDLIRDDLATLNVHHEVFYSERTLHTHDGNGPSKIDEMLDALRERDLVYQGTLPPPKGQVPEDWEDREQTLFRASDYSDDTDRALKKSDGSYTYFAADVAYFRDKFLRGYDEMIYVLGADHSGYAKRLEAVGQAISDGKAQVIVSFCQLVKLFKGGEPFKMSKRSGDFITLRDAVEEVGRDPIRFMMLYRKNDAPLDFDFEKVTEQSKDNPVFYVQYGHARCHSVLRQAAEEFPALDLGETALAAADFSVLTDEGELELISKLAQWPRVVDSAADTHEPHRVAFYLYDLASSLHAHWNRGKELPQLRFINTDNTKLTLARLALVRAISLVLASGLAVLGVNAPEEMR